MEVNKTNVPEGQPSGILLFKGGSLPYKYTGEQVPFPVHADEDDRMKCTVAENNSFFSPPLLPIL